VTTLLFVPACAEPCQELAATCDSFNVILILHARQAKQLQIGSSDLQNQFTDFGLLCQSNNKKKDHEKPMIVDLFLMVHEQKGVCKEKVKFTNLQVTTIVSLFSKMPTNAKLFTIVNLFGSHSNDPFTILLLFWNPLMNGKKGFSVVENDFCHRLCQMFVQHLHIMRCSQFQAILTFAVLAQ